MSYFNFKLCAEKQIHPSKLLSLAMLNQNRTEPLADIIESYMGAGGLKMLHEEGLVTYVKVKRKTDTLFMLARLSEKGKELLNELTEPPIEEQDEKVLTWLAEHFKKIGKETGNKKRTLRHIRDFRVKSSIEKNNLINLCLAFLNDDENMEYNHCMEYMFYKAKTVYATKFNLEDSRLYKYYLKYQEQFDKTFEKYE